jgi:uncharacterized membrane protein
VIVGIPTFFTDIYFTSRINDVNETRYVAPADYKACKWIKKSLPDRVVIQGEPEYLGFVGGSNDRQELYVSLIADFAARRQVLGWKYVAQELIPNGDAVVNTRSKDLSEMLSTADIDALRHFATLYGIDYIYVGPYEQALHPHLLDTLATDSRAFTEIYSVDGVHLFRLNL